MEKKRICKITVDLIMTVLLLLLMARQLIGDLAHEWLGAGMFLLWAAHHVLNRNWYRYLFKGKYTSIRIVQTVINFALLLAMLGCMVSGVILSREVFAFLPISGSLALARPLHIVSSFWGYVLMALHLGLHWNMIFNMICKITVPTTSMRIRFMRIGAVLIPASNEENAVLARAFDECREGQKPRCSASGFLTAGYGLYAFLKNQFLSYLFLRTHFVFFDFERPVLLFFTEYTAIMGLFVFLAHYGVKGLQRLAGRRHGTWMS